MVDATPLHGEEIRLRYGNRNVDQIVSKLSYRVRDLDWLLKLKTMNRTFEEVVKMPELIDGTEVTCRIGKSNFDGKIVGKSSSGLLPYYIVECMDETLPNETYQYKFVSLPLTEIYVK